MDDLEGCLSTMYSMLNLGKKSREKLSITHFGLIGHEVALFKSMIESAPELAEDCEFCDPNQKAACDIVMVNKDSQLATSWWKNYKKRHPNAIPLFLTDSKQDEDDGAFCKRPFSPTYLRGVVEDFVNKNK